MRAALTSRPYSDATDLRRIQALVARAYQITSLRVGDLAWLTRYYTHLDLALRVRLWEDDPGRLVGWTYLRHFGGFNVGVAPGHADAALLDEMLSVVDVTARASIVAGDPPVSLYTYGLDLSRSDEDRALAAALELHGFHAMPSTGGVMTRSLDQVPEPELPPGYHLGWVQTQEQMIGRVEAQRSAFAPSTFVLEHYERVRRTWPYRADLDRVALDENGSVVAFCTAWLDEENAAGLLEPVGTDPAHQRRGLARAVCTDALRALREAGAKIAQVGYESEAGRATYGSVGFTLSATDLVLRRDPA